MRPTAAAPPRRRRLRGGALAYRRREEGTVGIQPRRKLRLLLTSLLGFRGELGRVAARPGRSFASAQMAVPLAGERSDPAQPFSQTLTERTTCPEHA